MTEQIKITVIATGFNHEAAAQAEAQAGQRAHGHRPQSAVGRPGRDFDSPSFLRRPPIQPSTRTSPDASPSSGYSSLQDELDIPTFLRKQMD